jgi:hypothetical protein
MGFSFLSTYFSKTSYLASYETLATLHLYHNFMPSPFLELGDLCQSIDGGMAFFMFFQYFSWMSGGCERRVSLIIQCSVTNNLVNLHGNRLSGVDFVWDCMRDFSSKFSPFSILGTLAFLRFCRFSLRITIFKFSFQLHQNHHQRSQKTGWLAGNIFDAWQKKFIKIAFFEKITGSYKKVLCFQCKAAHNVTCCKAISVWVYHVVRHTALYYQRYSWLAGSIHSRTILKKHKKCHTPINILAQIT